jgi:hypothetical protein
MDPPSSSSIITDMMRRRNLPSDLLGFLINDLKSARMKLLVFIELTSIAFKNSLSENSQQNVDLLKFVGSITILLIFSLFLGRIDKRSALEAIIAKYCAPVVSPVDIHIYVNRLLYNSAIFFQVNKRSHFFASVNFVST